MLDYLRDLHPYSFTVVSKVPRNIAEVAMGTFSGRLFQLVDAQFRKDQSGRVVFLPYGPRKTGYYVETPSDDRKIKSFVAIYTAASLLFQVLGFLSSYLLMQAVIFPDRPTTRAGKLEVGLIVYGISALIFWFGPRWLLWKLYREVLPGVCSSLSEASPASTRDLEKTENPLQRRMVVIFIFVGAFLILVGVLLAAWFVHLHR